MEEADIVSSSSAPDEAPHDTGTMMNEAAAVSVLEEERTEETSSPQTTEVTTSQTSEVTTPQITEVTSTSQPAEVIVTPEMAKESTLSEVPVKQTSTETEVTSTSQTDPVITEAAVTNAEECVTNAGESVTPDTAEATPPVPEAVSPEVTPSEQTVSCTEAVTPEVTPSEQTVSCTEAVTPEVTPSEQTASCTEAVTPEVTPSEQTASCTEAREERVTPVKSAESPAPEISSSCAAHTHSLSSEARQEEEEEKHPHTLHPSSSSSSDDPDPPPAPGVTPALSQPQFPSDCWDSPSVASQASTNLTMDSLGHKDSAGVDPDVLSQSDDDFMFETKKSPFQAFSPLNDNLGETPADSPSPDLVQDAYDGEEAHAQSESRETKQELSLSYASDVNVASDDRPMSLPDILKSSPMNPEKVDSGSSEGSPEFSPAHRRGNDSPKSPFSASADSLDSKILLLKEMAEVTEARAAAEKAKLGEHNNSEQSFVAFDLVKETDVPPKSDSLLNDKVEVLSQTSVQMAHKFDCLNFPLGKAQEQWDSESPSADSFSPVLDAVTQKPSSFSAEQERRDEASEPEPSSEEFVFIEGPARGAAEDFLEMQDSLTFMKPASELDEDRSPELESVAEEEDQISDHLPTLASDRSSAGRGKSGLESDSQELSPTPVARPPGDKPGSGKRKAEAEGIPMSDPSAAAGKSVPDRHRCPHSPFPSLDPSCTHRVLCVCGPHVCVLSSSPHPSCISPSARHDVALSPFA
ncbi:unnamed protein product [Leuciscus chuanchicus]